MCSAIFIPFFLFLCLMFCGETYFYVVKTVRFKGTDFTTWVLHKISLFEEDWLSDQEVFIHHKLEKVLKEIWLMKPIGNNFSPMLSFRLLSSLRDDLDQEFSFPLQNDRVAWIWIHLVYHINQPLTTFKRSLRQLKVIKIYMYNAYKVSYCYESTWGNWVNKRFYSI